MRKRTGLKDIAEALDISVTTVSRALNDKYDISAKTKELVIQKAEELDYRPNAHAVSLRRNEYFALGVILPSIDHYFFSTVLKGVMNKAHMANYLVIIGESTHDPDKEKEIIEKFISHCVTGVIISPSNKTSYSSNLERLKTRRIPYIVVDRPTDNSQENIVRYDDKNGAFLAVEHMIQQGYKKIAFIKGFDYCVISNARLEGYKAALNKYDLAIDDSLIKSILDIDGVKDGYELSKQMLLQQNKPDAFFAVTDNVASGIYKTAKELDISIPRELGVVGYSNSKLSRYLNPPLSTVEQPGVEMGEQAFDFLQKAIIDGNKHLPLSKTFEARLLVRESSIPKF